VGLAKRCAVPLALILLATTWPLSEFQNHTHWAQVEWVPFTKYVRPFDILANVALFAPLGATVAWGSTSRRRVGAATLAALVLSLLIEWSQVYTHNRAATTTDVLTNTLGAWLGARWSLARAARVSASAAGSSPAPIPQSPSDPR
jgi:glycopeptide antibiotics resistance protein